MARKRTEQPDRSVIHRYAENGPELWQVLIPVVRLLAERNVERKRKLAEEQKTAADAEMAKAA